MDALPETIANFALLSSGCAFSYIFFIPVSQYESTNFWPYIIMILFAIVTAMVLLISKFNNNRFKFHHFYLCIIANAFFLAAAIQLLIFGDYNEILNAIYLMAAGIGITHVASLSYIAVRTTKHERSARVALSYFAFFLGFSTSTTVLDLVKDSYGIVLTGFSGILFLTFILNEIFQLCKIYDYKKCRDMEMNDLNLMATIFERKPVKQDSPLDLLNTNIFAESGWKSTNKLMKNDITAKRGFCNYGVAWLFYMISTNLVGFVVFYQMFMNTAFAYVDLITVSYVLVWMIAAGALVGAGLLFFVSTKHIFLATASCCLISFLPLLVFLWLDFKNVVGIMFLIFYFFLGMLSSIPDTSTIEISSLKNTEVSLSAGFTLKMLAICVVQYINYVQNAIEDKYFFTSYAIVVILIIIISSILILLHLPNTFRKTLLEIHDYLDTANKYTVWQKTTKPFSMPERAFDFHDHSQTYTAPQKPRNQPINQIQENENHSNQYPSFSVNPSTIDMPANTSAIQHDLLTSMERYNYKDSVNIFPRPRLSPTAVNLSVYRQVEKRL